MKRPIRQITCCCSNGLGSSMIVELNVRKVLAEMGITNLSVQHVPLSDTAASPRDLFVVGLDIAPQMKSFSRVIVLHNLIDKEELRGKLEQALGSAEETFWIE